MDQLSFASLDFAAKKKRTKRDVFLAEMTAVVPWVEFEAVIEPHYPKVGPHGGRRPGRVAPGMPSCTWRQAYLRSCRYGCWFAPGALVSAPRVLPSHRLRGEGAPKGRMRGGRLRKRQICTGR